jgi:hypothetical protein
MLDRVCSVLRFAIPRKATVGFLFASGTTKPTNGTSGYASGCIYLATSGSAGARMYVNEGSVTSCAFELVKTEVNDVIEVAINIPALAAGADQAETYMMAFSQAVTLQSIAVVMGTNAIGTIDDSNTSVFLVKDSGANTIVTKTYNAATQPTAPGVNDLGTLSSTHKILTAGESVTLTITNGASAATPVSQLRLVAKLTY